MGILNAYLPTKNRAIAKIIPIVKIINRIPFAIFLLLALAKKFNKRYKETKAIPMSKK